MTIQLFFQLLNVSPTDGYAGDFIVQKGGWVSKSEEGAACCSGGWRRRWLTISGSTFAYATSDTAKKAILTVDITPTTVFDTDSSFEFSST